MTLAEQYPQGKPWLSLSELAGIKNGSEIREIFFEPEPDQLAQNGIDLVCFLDGHWHLLDTPAKPGLGMVATRRLWSSLGATQEISAAWW
jgi:hypothetical protein